MRAGAETYDNLQKTNSRLITKDRLIALPSTGSTGEWLEVCSVPNKTHSVQCVVERGPNDRAPKSIQSSRNTREYYAMLGV